jgi:hypothetical protein
MFSVRCLFIGNKPNIEHPIPQSGTEHSIGSFLRRNHAAFPRVIEQAAGVHDRADVAERFEFIFSAAVRR